jgi:chromosome partitioning protein
VTKPSSGASSSSARKGSSVTAGDRAKRPANPKKATKTPTKQRPVPPETPGPARLIAIANQKGGVGKSTTAVSLGAALADLGYHVLVVDLDPQGNASTGMGIRHEARDVTVYDVIVAEAPVIDAIVETPVPRLHAVPSTIDLAGAEIELVSQFSREGRLKKALEPVRHESYDFIFFDCPPSLGLLTVNALTAAEELIVPIQCEYYALEGLGQLLRNVNLVQANINPGLRLSGIVMTMYDPRTKLSEQVVEEVQRYFGDLVYDVIIPRTVRLSEAPGYGQPITVYDPKSRGAETYRELAREVALRPPPDSPMPTFDELPLVVVPAVQDEERLPAAPIDEEELEEIELPMVHDLVEETHTAPAEVDVVEDEVEADAVQDEVADAIESAFEDVDDEASEPVAPGPTGPALEAVWEDEAEEAPRVRPVTNRPVEAPERRVVVIDEDSDLDIRAGQEPLVDRPQRAAVPADEEEPEIGATLRDEEGEGKRRWRLFRKGGE